MYSILILPRHIRISSAICVNLAAAFIISLPASQTIFILTGNLFGSIIFTWLSIKAEELLDIYD